MLNENSMNNSKADYYNLSGIKNQHPIGRKPNKAKN